MAGPVSAEQYLGASRELQRKFQRYSIQLYKLPPGRKIIDKVNLPLLLWPVPIVVNTAFKLVDMTGGFGILHAPLVHVETERR